MPEESRTEEVVWLDSCYETYQNTRTHGRTQALGMDTGGRAPYVIPVAVAIESLAASGPTKVVGLGASRNI